MSGMPGMAGPGAGGTAGGDGYRILVGFSGETDLPWLRCLRPGFRHCFAAVECGGGWLLYEPASHQTRLHALGATDMVTLWNQLHAGGTTVVCRRTQAAPPRLAPIRPYTCVEAIKRLLGIHAPWTLTPWQLYRHLTACDKKKYKLTEKILDFLKKPMYTPL